MPGIDNRNSVPYQKENEDELKFFTYGLPSSNEQHNMDNVVKIELQPMLGGFVTNKQSLCYDVSYRLSTGFFK